jgi:hypothetical protein
VSYRHLRYQSWGHRMKMREILEAVQRELACNHATGHFGEPCSYGGHAGCTCAILASRKYDAQSHSSSPSHSEDGHS